VSASTGQAGLIAESGFNDQAGINSDPTLYSPYELAHTVHQHGGLEPGWGGEPWVVGYGVPLVTAEADDPVEGDGVMKMVPDPGPNKSWVRR